MSDNAFFETTDDTEMSEEEKYQEIMSFNSYWHDTELYHHLRSIIDKKCKCESIDDKLDRLVRSIPGVIRGFTDCSSAELYRSLAKKQDGTLATIQLFDSKRGFTVYKPIELNPRDYKKFYYETLAYSLITYIMFFKDIEYKIKSNDVERSGILKITVESLPHILGLESKFVSSKDCQLLERIIPGYNSLSILDKIFSLIINNEKIIQFEEENGYDIFNYYKNMQKNKDFLLMGRFFSNSESGVEDKNKVILISQSDNQLCLYKQSNMNDTMNRNACKMIIQRLDNGDYFPRSLQSLLGSELEAISLSNYLSTIGRVQSDGTLELEFEFPNPEEGTMSYYFAPLYYDELELYISQRDLINMIGGDGSIVEEYSSIKHIQIESGIKRLLKKIFQ